MLVEPEGSPSLPDPLADRLSQAVAPRYRLGTRLGRGGMAIVYSAQESVLNREVAIKVIDPAKIYEDGTEARFRAEAIAAASLRHPHIVAIHEWGECGDLLWFVMDRLSGGSLRDLIRREGRLPGARLARLLGQISAALHHAHRQGVLHRDVNPANILLDEQGNAFVADFGIAKIQGSSTLTDTGTSVGTAQYMSAEQLMQTGEVSAASDQFSAGVTAFEMLTNSRPFTGDTAAQIAVALDRGHRPNIRSLAPETPADLAVLIDRMLERRPEDRWPDMEIVQRLSEEIAVLGSAPSLRIVTRRTSRRRARVAVWLMLAVGLAWFAGWTLSGGWEAPPPAPELSGNVQDPNGAAGAGREESDLGESPTDTAHSSGSAGNAFQPRSLPPALGNPVRVASSPPRSAEPRAALGLPASDESLVVREPVPPQPSLRSGPAFLLVGSRGENVYLYVNEDKPIRLGALAWIPVTTFGTVLLSFRSQGCQIMNESIVLQEGDSVTVGYRNPVCP